MNEYQKMYIELKKQFKQSDGSLENVTALYKLKVQLEKSEEKQVKEVLVNVQDLLDYKKDAYEPLETICNPSDMKARKQLGKIKQYAENWKNDFAIPKPKTKEEIRRQKEHLSELGIPRFRYHPDPVATDAFEKSEEGQICDCCGKTTHICYSNPFYTVDDIEYLFPECTANGSPPKKLPKSFLRIYSLSFVEEK